jgi:hypothetical protein
MKKIIDNIRKEERQGFKDGIENIWGRIKVSFRDDRAFLDIPEISPITEETLIFKSRTIKQINDFIGQVRIAQFRAN